MCRDTLRYVVVICLLMAAATDAASDPAHFPFSSGETIYYDIKKLGLKVGEAKLVFDGPVTLDSRSAWRVTLTVKSLNFSDQEQIYLDPKTLYPLVIKRNLNLWGKKEVIIEHYAQEKGVVKIVKHTGGKRSETTIAKPAPLDNIYGFIYRYRTSGQFKIGETLKMRLPTRDVEFQLVATGPLKTTEREWQAYYLQSTPKKYKVWFEQGANKIPLRIDGALGVGQTSMIMTSYHKAGG